MSSEPQKANPNVQAIRHSFGRVVYSHKTHEKAREIASRNANMVKWANIILTTLTSGTLLATVITNQRAALWTSAALSALTLAFVVFQLSFDPAKEAERHRTTAKELWLVREQYINLLADIAANSDAVDIPKLRDELTDQLQAIYKFAPDTTGKAYLAAQKALKVSEDMTFGEEEINAFLPESLHQPA